MARLLGGRGLRVVGAKERSNGPLYASKRGCSEMKRIPLALSF